MYTKREKVAFPVYQGNMFVNMMPFLFGDKNSIPSYLHGYLPLIEKCTKFEMGKVAYLTVTESCVKQGMFQRRSGVHTEGTSVDNFGGGGWGGGDWGGEKKGVYMASTDGSCRIWNHMTKDVDFYGALLLPITGEPELMEANTLYWLTDRTPHEALPVNRDIERQYFRLVSNEVSVWWKQHSTSNPLGVQPDCKVFTHSKFEQKS